MRAAFFFASFFVACFSWAQIDLRGKAFLEEPWPGKWSKQCQDWPLSLAPVYLDPKPNPQISIQKINNSVRLRGIVHFKSKNVQSLDRVFQKVQAYPAWIMPGINNKAGGSYFVQLGSMKAQYFKNRKYIALSNHFDLKLFFFKRSGASTMFVRRALEKTPDCALFKEQKAIKYVFRMIPRPSVLKYFIAEFWLLSDGESAQIHWRAVAKLPNLLYQILPEKLLRSELEQRSRRIFQNLLEVVNLN